MSPDTISFKILKNHLQDEGPYQIELLSGGLSGSKIYKVETLKNTYALRFWNKKWIDYYPQDLVGQFAGSDGGYGPKVYYSDIPNCITVMDYLPHTPPKVENRLAALAELLKKIHQSPALPEGINKEADYQDSIEEFSKLNLPYADFNLIQSVKDAIMANRQKTKVTCHRDMHPGNISYSKNQYWAFDYTWCGMDDPYYDIATIALFHCKDEAEDKILLSLYFGFEATKKELAKLNLFKQASKMFYGFEFLRLYPFKSTTFPSFPLTNRYLVFGLSGFQFIPDDYAEFSLSLLSEVVNYARNGNLEKDLSDLQ